MFKDNVRVSPVANRSKEGVRKNCGRLAHPGCDCPPPNLWVALAYAADISESMLFTHKVEAVWDLCHDRLEREVTKTWLLAT